MPDSRTFDLTTTLDLLDLNQDIGPTKCLKPDVAARPKGLESAPLPPPRNLGWKGEPNPS